MKKLLLIPVSLIVFIACNSDSKTSEKKEESATTAPATTAPAETDITENPDYKAGLALIAKSDCLTCHNVTDKINGPAYRDVANKYAGMPDTIVSHLAKKIINGGSGVWGEVPMIPHPNLSQADAETLVKYVLLLKK